VKSSSEFGTIDILITLVGWFFGKFLELEPTDWERIIQVNLMGPYYVTRAVVPNMIEKTNWILSTFHQLLVGRKCNDLMRQSASKFALVRTNRIH
jgi:3-oxoacyl-[acyl-carrier protein] reductase